MNRPFIDPRGSLINNAPYGTRERAENSSSRRAFVHATRSQIVIVDTDSPRGFSPGRLVLGTIQRDTYNDLSLEALKHCTRNHIINNEMIGLLVTDSKKTMTCRRIIETVHV